MLHDIMNLLCSQSHPTWNLHHAILQPLGWSGRKKTSPLWQPSWRVLLFFSASWRFADLDRRCSLARKHLKPSQKFTIEFNKPEICLGYFVDWVVLRLPKPPKSDGGDELKAGLLRRWSLVQVSTDPASHNVPSDRFLFEIVVATKQKASYTNDGAIFYCQQLSYSSIRSFWKIVPTQAQIND